MAFLNPGKRPLHHPPLRHNCEGMKFIAFGNLYRRPQNFIHSLSKRASCIASIGQYVDDLAQKFLMPHKCSQCPFSICNVGYRHGKSMGEPLCINGDMALDPRYFFTRIVAFGFGSIRVLYTLCVNDQKGAVFVPTMFDTGRANLIFLRPAPANSIHFPTAFLIPQVYAIISALAKRSRTGS